MITQFLEELYGPGSESGGTLLRLLPCPKEYVGQPYGELVAHLALRKRLVVLGLYRQKVENPAWRLPFVHTNPPREAVLRESDRVYVLRDRGLGGDWLLEGLGLGGGDEGGGEGG